MHNARSAEVIIIGAGVVGMSIAWHLGLQGIHCLCVEQNTIGAGATSVQAGGVRTQWTTPVTIAMAVESSRFYGDIDSRLSPAVDPSFDAGGYLFAATEESTLRELEQAVELQRSLGVDTSVLDTTGVAALVDGLVADEIVGGTFNGADGYFDRPDVVAQAFADAAVRSGLAFVKGTVDRITADGPDWTVVLDDRRTYTAPLVVVAAGLDTAGLVATQDVPLPVHAAPRSMFLSEPHEGQLVRPLLILQDQRFVVKHLADGRILACDLTYEDSGSVADRNCRSKIADVLRRFLPEVSSIAFPRVRVGAYDVTPDNQLVVGPLPARPGLWVATGMNGRGMMLAPAVGRMIADAITLGAADAIPAELLPERFTSGRPLAAEGQML
ncbi:FAD-binding oxidoreductase [Kribbella albertanoniae]|uniref:FAD-binding oxidoreductase n=1 Tax=Kribbella albertanoniae TaxID=1266829 RepID=A0A4R4QIB0_9ACTN|nr:FAD-binding oxidoreductase [Kribbella albertanoniae]TDC35501.1 FAD-binding oxidoreductase [Kribbella albertanoniae]